MIKAAYINNLFEEWKSVRGKKIEVLDNPSSWREAFSAFKPDLRELKKKGISQLLRFVYHPKTKEIKIWIGYEAVHEDIIRLPALHAYWLGWIDSLRRTVEVVTTEGDTLTSLDESPVSLAKFLWGLEFGDVNIDDYEDYQVV